MKKYNKIVVVQYHTGKMTVFRFNSDKKMLREDIRQFLLANDDFNEEKDDIFSIADEMFTVDISFEIEQSLAE